MLVVSVASWLPAAVANAAHRAESVVLSSKTTSAAVFRYVDDHPHGPNPHGGNPHGADPHGDDPYDERHDPDLPANKEQDRYKAPKGGIKDQEYPPR
jgi:hypothetical protein